MRLVFFLFGFPDECIPVTTHPTHIRYSIRNRTVISHTDKGSHVMAIMQMDHDRHDELQNDRDLQISIMPKYRYIFSAFDD